MRCHVPEVVNHVVLIQKSSSGTQNGEELRPVSVSIDRFRLPPLLESLLQGHYTVIHFLGPVLV